MNSRARKSTPSAQALDAALIFQVNCGALLWEKFIGLVANSSLCALLRSPMGVVQQDDDCWALYSALFSEVVAAGRASGISIPEQKAQARLANARTSPPQVMPSMAVDLIAGNRLELP